MVANVAVVGCGYWGKNLVRNFAQLGALRTMCDADPTVLESLKPSFPGVKSERDFGELLSDDSIRGVVIAAPAASHYSMSRQALLAGKDVFVEKPLALKVEEGEELVRLSEQMGRTLMVGHLMEYHPAVVKLKELVDRGELGKIRYIYSNRLNLGKFRTEENILWSFAPHDISIILLLLGGEMPKEVTAHGGYYLHQDIADVSLTAMKFSDGVRAHIFVSWLHPFKEQRLVVVGDRKMAEFNDANPTDKLLLFNHEIGWVDRKPVPHASRPEVVSVSSDEPLKIECQDFVDCLETRRQPRVDGRKGLQVLRVLAACQESLEEGKGVTLGNQEAKGVFVDETSVVDKPCQIGEGTKIWHFSHIMRDAAIGKNCVIGQNVFVGKGVIIGNGVKLENNVSVFERVTLEDDVFCGPSCVFTNVFNPRSAIDRKDEMRATLVKRGATIGANATIVCGHTIGRYAFIGAGAVVTKDIPDYALAYGSPARVRGWVCECGVKLEEQSGRARCPGCGKLYRIENDACSPWEGDE